MLVGGRDMSAPADAPGRCVRLPMEAVAWEDADARSERCVLNSPWAVSPVATYAAPPSDGSTTLRSAARTPLPAPPPVPYPTASTPQPTAFSRTPTPGPLHEGRLASPLPVTGSHGEAAQKRQPPDGGLDEAWMGALLPAEREYLRVAAERREEWRQQAAARRDQLRRLGLRVASLEAQRALAAATQE